MADSVRAWRPEVPLVREVLHATFERHAYPAHTHDAWTVLLVDDGAVTYALDRAPHDAVPATLTLLPPHVPHDGRSAVRGRPFRKRVLYLDPAWLPAPAADAAVAEPLLRDPVALAVVADVHGALDHPADAMAAECGVLTLRDVVRSHLGSPASTARDAPLARRLRDLLDDRLAESFTIEEAARVLGAHPSHLVRVFSQTYGIPPHRYVTGRRVDDARRLLLQGRSPAEAAAAVGFHDQAHLTRHFRRVLGTTPGAFAA
ncbi:AraC family transcriptional regulator [Cellulosimicrobium composti]|uniref:AraC family transcriptional regulator n=1 Tax=Cellulosimicrobium composti TaxID=2672572 RepID=UPI0037A5AA4A